MARLGFMNAFDNLLGRWKSHDDEPRQPERVAELAQSRLELDHARQETAEARQQYITRGENPDKPFSKTSIPDDEVARIRAQIYPGSS